MMFYFPKSLSGRKYESRCVFRLGRFVLAIYRFKWKFYFIVGFTKLCSEGEGANVPRKADLIEARA